MYNDKRIQKIYWRRKMEELDLKDLFTVFWEKKAQIILIVLIFAVIGIAYSYFVVEPEYKAKTKLVLTQSLEGTEDGAITQADITLNSKLVSTYGELIKTVNDLDITVSLHSVVLIKEI